MKVVASICRVAGERVAVVAVDKSVVEYQSEADRYIDALSPAFDGLPVVLLARDEAGNATYFGREDLCQGLSPVPPDDIPWQELDLDL